MRNRLRRVAAIGTVALLGALVGGPAVAASAQTPPDLDQGHVSDFSDVLSDSQETRLEQRLGELASADGLPELYVVLVPDFEDPSNALAWADATALRNNLAPDQYLLAIATDGRSLAISAEYGGDGVDAGPLAENRVLEIENDLGSRYLADDDWDGGIAFVADEFSQVPVPWWVWLLGVAGLAALVFAVTRLVLFLRRRAALAAELRTLEGQKKTAARRLVQADEAVRTSEQELGFVTAEFGEETTASFTALLADCRTRLQKAFGLLEKLQDAEEDTTQETREWTDTILRLCREVDDALDARRQELASLRALAEGAADTLARLRAARADAESLQSEAVDRLASLAAAFAPADLIGVVDNADQIGARLRAADAQLDALQKAVDARKPKAITDAVHEIERLLAEARDLRAAIEAQADALATRSTAAETAVVPGVAGVGSGDAASIGSGTTGSVLSQAAAAVRAAEASVQARPGGVSAFTLARLHSAQQLLSRASVAPAPADAERQAASALAAAEQVQGLVGAATAPEGRRFVRSSPSSHPADNGAVMYDTAVSSAARESSWRLYTEEEDSEGTGGKAAVGAISGGVIGLVSGLGFADGNAGIVVMFVLGGGVFGALMGAFGSSGGGGGSSSGWGGSSRSSWGGSSRSSRGFSSSRSSSRSSGGSRSSGRSGGRRF
ncbi:MULTISPECIES: TPM domain-containing protein [unclassified Microbacterium]|uniref:TPM domain-containing protein n=1 Tax=unclassified Microbacterium TaxID=2609290 RepID=UPI0018DF2828|nr:TPM domain-containing protein [Microbacterium sp. MAH-37]